MDTEDRKQDVGRSEDFEVGFFRPQDAQGIVRLFQAVYGDGYPIRVFYDPEALTTANAIGQYYSIVARTPSGEVAGVQHAFRSAPYERLYEAGAGLVLKEYRNLALTKRMLHFLFDEWIPKQANVEETFGEAVCNHVYMQRTVAQMGHVETALEVALMPAEAYDKEGSASGRVAALLAFRCYKPRPHAIFLPEVYDKELRFIYSGLDDVRTLASADRELPTDESSYGEITVFDFARVARIAMHRTGADFDRSIHDLERTALDRKALVIQIWLKLSSPWVGSAVDILRGRGYFFGGALPRWFDDDGLLMQKLFVNPDFDGIQLHEDRAKEILGMIRDDWSRTRASNRHQ